MVPEAPLEQSEVGLYLAGEGWFVLNAREALWVESEGRGAALPFDARTPFPQVGVRIYVLAPGEPMAIYHREADQEDFLVLSGEPLLIVEGEEQRLRKWDFVHCPPGTSHVIIGAGDGPSAVLAVGARVHSVGEDWGSYTVSEAAVRHGAGVAEETSDPDIAYARFPEWQPARYREGSLRGD